MLHHALLEQEEEEKGLTGLASRRSHNFHTFRAVSLELSPPAAVGPWQELPALLVAMLMSAINAVSYGSLLFAWPRPSGTVVWLLSSIGTQLGTLMASNISNGISCPMMEMIPIFHAMFVQIGLRMPEAAEEEVRATCLAAAFVCTLSIGSFVLLITELGLARYLRAVPLIVLKGALFGVALFLLSSCLSVAAPSGALQRAAPAVLLGLGLFALDEQLHSPVVIAISLLLIALFPSFLGLFGIPLEQLQQDGWVFEPHSAAGVWYEEIFEVYRSAIFKIHWFVILELVPTICGIAASASLLMLMDLKAVELLTERDFVLDKELRSIGVSNICSALLGGGWPCYILCSLNVTCHRLGGRSRFVGLGLIASSICSLQLVQQVVPRLPRALPGSLFMWLSLVFAKETIVDICAKYTHYSDVAIVAIMALVVKFYSFNDGLFIGTLLAMSMFTIRYSGSQAGVRTAGDARFYRSICTRDGVEREALEQLGHLIAVVHVDGFLMFGSTPAFTDTVRELMCPKGPEWILLNLMGLYGLDYSAALELATLARKAREAQKYLVLTELRPCVQEVLLSARVEMMQLPRTGVDQKVMPGLYYQAHYQRALQRCEDGVLSRLGRCMPSRSYAAGLGSEESFMCDVLRRYFGDFLPEKTSLKQILSIFSKRTLEPGSTLWRAGERCGYCVCVTEGSLHAMQPMKKGDACERLISIAGPGDFLGFMAMLNGFPYEQTAVVPEEENELTTVLVLEQSRYHELLLSEPPLAQALLRGFLRQVSYELRELSRLG